MRLDVRRSLDAWTRQQSFPRELYEVIVTGIRGDPAFGRIADVVATADRVLELTPRSLPALYNAAARVARGCWLVITEAHAEPDSGFLAACARHFAACDGVAACAGSRPIPGNLLSRLEHRLYTADYVSPASASSWNQVLVRGFIVRRDAYLALNGMDERFGHFAEPVLGIILHRAGISIGHIADALVHHAGPQYLSQLVPDLIAGGRDESRYRAWHDPRNYEGYIGRDPEWQARAALPSSSERALVITLLRDAFSARRGAEALRALATLAARRAAPLVAALRLGIAGIGVLLCIPASGPRVHRFRVAWHACLRLGRLLETPRAVRPGLAVRGEAIFKPPFDVRFAAGLYEPEQADPGHYQWTAPIATFRLDLAVRDWRIDIATAGHRPEDAAARLRVYFDGRRVPCLQPRGSRIIRIRLPGAAFAQGPGHLLVLATDAWVPATRGAADSRRLGIAIVSLRAREAAVVRVRAAAPGR